MTRSYYIRDEESESTWIRRVIIALMLIALAAGLSTGIYIYRANRQPDLLLNEFKLAMETSRYEKAIGLYREAQEKALTGSFLNRSQDQFADVLKVMEEMTRLKLQFLEGKVLKMESLDAASLSFAEGMSELSAVRLAAFLRGLCLDYLMGRIDRPLLESAFSQLAPLDNLYNAIGSLPAEFDRMAAAQQPMMMALVSLDSGDYWAAYEGFSAMVADENLAGFVSEQADKRLEECKARMFSPLLEAARALMDGGRFLSAKTDLEKMILVFPDDPAILAEIEKCRLQVPAELVNFLGDIEAIVIRPLIVSPAKAFDQDAYASAADDSMITTTEFRNMLEQLYANQFILVDSSRIYNDSRHLVTLKLPPGKKPLILVIEGLNYYAIRRETGNCWDLVIDEGGEVSGEYPDESGRMKIDRQGEAIGILDEFVKEHPDFSLDGAKGTISLTGYECIFGKITDADQLDDRNLALQNSGMQTIAMTGEEIAANRKNAQDVIDRLKETGWLFASSTYGFIDARSQPMERIKTDTQKWLAQVGALTGPVGMLNYPYGTYITGSDERAVWLKEQGFILFSGLAGAGQGAYLYIGSDYLYIDKTPINGYTLRRSSEYNLERFFDAAQVYDRSVRPK